MLLSLSCPTEAQTVNLSLHKHHSRAGSTRCRPWHRRTLAQALREALGVEEPPPGIHLADHDHRRGGDWLSSVGTRWGCGVGESLNLKTLVFAADHWRLTCRQMHD